MAMMVRLRRGLLDLIWPPRSLLSDARVEKNGTIEADLWHSLDFLHGPSCELCGLPLPDAIGIEITCPTCLAQPGHLRFMRAPLAYDDLSKPLVLGMKHGARKDGVTVYANWMIGIAPFVQDADLIVPVPLHWTRLWTRGYNQAAWLAQTIARKTPASYAPLVLIRKRATPTQNGLSFSGRRRNVEGAFTATRDVAGKHIVLVDDVYTTGATFNACAKALKKAGARIVDGVALTRVVKPTHMDVPTEVLSAIPRLLKEAND